MQTYDVIEELASKLGVVVEVKLEAKGNSTSSMWRLAARRGEGIKPLRQNILWQAGTPS